MTSHRVAVFSAIVSLVSTWAYNPPRARPGKVSAAIAHSDSIIERVIRERVDLGLNAGLVVGLIDSTGRQHVYAVGVVRGPGSPRVDVNTVFEIGSITKTFTASLLADMVQRGEVALDDPVTNYLPSDARFKANGRAITLVDLATQSSGLPPLPANFIRPTPKIRSRTTRPRICTSFSPATHRLANRVFNISIPISELGYWVPYSLGARERHMRR